jgi:hypothetical protein
MEANNLHARTLNEFEANGLKHEEVLNFQVHPLLQHVIKMITLEMGSHYPLKKVGFQI